MSAHTSTSRQLAVYVCNRLSHLTVLQAAKHQLPLQAAADGLLTEPCQRFGSPAGVAQGLSISVSQGAHIPAELTQTASTRHKFTKNPLYQPRAHGAGPSSASANAIGCSHQVAMPAAEDGQCVPAMQRRHTGKSVVNASSSLSDDALQRTLDQTADSVQAQHSNEGHGKGKRHKKRSRKGKRNADHMAAGDQSSDAALGKGNAASQAPPSPQNSAKGKLGCKASC